MNISFVNKNGEPVFWTGVKEIKISSDSGYSIQSEETVFVVKEGSLAD